MRTCKMARFIGDDRRWPLRLLVVDFVAIREVTNGLARLDYFRSDYEHILLNKAKVVSAVEALLSEMVAAGYIERHWDDAHAWDKYHYTLTDKGHRYRRWYWSCFPARKVPWF